MTIQLFKNDLFTDCPYTLFIDGYVFRMSEDPISLDGMNLYMGKSSEYKSVIGEIKGWAIPLSFTTPSIKTAINNWVKIIEKIEFDKQRQIRYNTARNNI